LSTKITFDEVHPKFVPWNDGKIHCRYCIKKRETVI